MNKDFSEFKKNIKGKKIAVVGIGISNRPLINFLIKLGGEVTAFDKKDREQLGSIVKDLEGKNVKLILGSNYLTYLTGFHIIFKTPSMRIDSNALLKAKNEGAYITSEIEEFIRYCPSKIFGITGSDGKTTTTTLVSNMLKEEGYKTWVGGNIGIPLFSQIENIKKEDKVVLELSSFQLMTVTEPVEVALITNLSPNHLDIHKDMEEYIDAKRNIFKWQRNNDVVILNKDNSITNSMTDEAVGELIQFSIKDKLDKGAYFKSDKLYINEEMVCDINEIKLKGMHNIENLLAAFCCVSRDVSLKSMRKVATSFTGVEHRMEFIREYNGALYYNDSIASSPTRTLAGLNAFNEKVILIAGGYDKKISFKILAEEGYSFIKRLILLGDTKEKIQKEFERVMKESNVYIPINIVASLEEAIEVSKKYAKKGDIVTLSPACASFDMFSNFEVRGNRFKEIVNRL
ncbi:UDP-N-acetylmuramoyl-L-alanine--D-glutamate ligase [Clostridium rectalis]|uniref:UDP-N-acetylmuramoyl-L-alanine--D-glutamate ligase n=1 Tax=Clostridium rectalis TaxID=2040295 RepID=UPI000F644009|nr:UDP-N-acetylmuramoyl-L-alanine--D-glutamate ligase [Clostridium rectalis]